MILRSLNVFFCVVCMFMFCINITKAERMMKMRHPELVFRKTTFREVISGTIGILAVSICPIMNLICLYYLMRNEREFIEDYIAGAYNDYHKDDYSEVY